MCAYMVQITVVKCECTSFKRRELFQEVLCCSDCSERVVETFAHQIQSEYYGVNRSVYIEGISLEHFSALTKGRYQFNYTITSKTCKVLVSLSHYSKQDAVTTTKRSNLFIALIKDKKIIDAIFE